MTTTLICLRGLPGSGKSTLAKELIRYSDAPPGDMVRLNRDDLRASLFGGEGILSSDRENLITKIQRQTAVEALRAGKHVIVDDTNLRLRYLREWNQLALDHDAKFEVHDVHTPVVECILRDSVRDRKVGEKVIRDLAQKFYRDGTYPLYEPLKAVSVEKVLYDVDLPDVILCDIDGTLTLGPNNRSPYDWSKVRHDLPRWDVVNLVRELIRDGHPVVFMSGRDSVCREDTEAWISEFVLAGFQKPAVRLLMRKEGDVRQDSVVKQELFDQWIRGQFNVSFVLDDRDQVVRMWRDLGLTCMQVDYGNF